MAAPAEAGGEVANNGTDTVDVLYVVERETDACESARTAVDIVCAGDSLWYRGGFGGYNCCFDWYGPVGPI